MSKDSLAVKNKTREYIALLKNKTTQDLTLLRDRLKQKFKEERSRPTLNKRLINDYNIQLSLIGRELKSRLPIHEQGDNFQAVEDATVNEVGHKTFEQKLKDKTLDELNAMVVNGKKKLDRLNSIKSEPNISLEKLKSIEDKINYFGEKMAEIQAEIEKRTNSGSSDKNENSSSATDGSRLFGIDKDYIIPALAGGVVVGAIGYSFGKNILGFGLIGIGVGSGIVWLSKNSSISKTVNS